MPANSITTQTTSVRRFALGQTFIAPGVEESLQIAGQTAIEFLRLHMSCDFSELSEEDFRENQLAVMTASCRMSCL